jgi:hypothetical protein
MEEAVNCHLLEENWIPVFWNNGNGGRVGIRAALAEAGRIRQVAASGAGEVLEERTLWRLTPGKGGRPRKPLGHENQSGLALPT